MVHSATMSAHVSANTLEVLVEVLWWVGQDADVRGMSEKSSPLISEAKLWIAHPGRHSQLDCARKTRCCPSLIVIDGQSPKKESALPG